MWDPEFGVEVDIMYFEGSYHHVLWIPHKHAPQHIEEVDKLVQKIADAQEKLQVLKDFEPERSIL